MIELLESEEAVFSTPRAKAAPVCLRRENSYGLVTLWDMYQFYAHAMVRLFDELRDLELEVGRQLPMRPPPEEEKEVSARFLQRLADIKVMCEVLQLASAQKQVIHILEFMKDRIVKGDVVSPKLAELRRRIREDLEEHVYLCIPSRAAQRCFRKDAQGLQQIKVSSELMDPKVAERFPAALDDIEAAYKCLVFDCYPASMFHLMRVVEIAVLKLAKVAGLKDPSPSWGAVLQHVEKIVLRTKFEDVPLVVQPYRKLLETVLPQMQAIQRAWRNKFTHVEDKIIPAEAVLSESVAVEIITAVEAFMRQLAYDLPPDV